MYVCINRRVTLTLTCACVSVYIYIYIYIYMFIYVYIFFLFRSTWLGRMGGMENTRSCWMKHTRRRSLHRPLSSTPVWFTHCKSRDRCQSSRNLLYTHTFVFLSLWIPCLFVSSLCLFVPVCGLLRRWSSASMGTRRDTRVWHARLRSRHSATSRRIQPIEQHTK
jgi:hypothetical protein